MDDVEALGMGGGENLPLDMQVITLREELAKAELENEILRKYFGMIVGDEPTDYLMSDKDIARAALKTEVTDKTLRAYIADAVTSVIHPEFGSAWREGGELYKLFNGRPQP